MRQSLLALFVLSIILTPYVKSEDAFSIAIEEIQTDIDRLVPSEDKANFYAEYYETTDLLKTFNFSLVFKKNFLFKFHHFSTFFNSKSKLK
jgi:hypothetical protein